MKWFLILLASVCATTVKVIHCRCEKVEQKMQLLLDSVEQQYNSHTNAYNMFWGNCIVAVTFDDIDLVYVPP